MANGSPDRPRSSGLFSGLLLISIGVLMLFWTYAHLNLGHFFVRFWPLILIVWGIVKFYERTVAVRQGRTSGWITAGEIFLVVGVFCLIGVVVIVDLVREKIDSKGGMERIARELGDEYSFDLEMKPEPIPANARVQINVPRADISVHASDEPQSTSAGQRESVPGMKKPRKKSKTPQRWKS